MVQITLGLGKNTKRPYVPDHRFLWRSVVSMHPGEIAAPGRGRKHEIQKSERCAGCTVPAQLRVSSRYTDAKRGKVLGSKTCH